MKNYINMLISWVIINLNSKDKALIDFDYFKAMFFPFSYLKISIYRFLLFLFYLSLYYSVDLGLLTKAFSHNSNDSYIFFNIIFTIIHFFILPYMWFFASFKNKISHKINIEYAYISLIFIVALLYLFYNIFPSFSLLVISLIIHIVCYFFRVKTIYLFFLTIAIFITYYQQFYKIFSEEVILNINLFYMYLALAINYIYNKIISKLK
ncbi:hypothetical protein AVBRAN12640_05905 [Campylobacter sp. RM12640]|uniref:hypothetical protein n=1 Tax=unclassified Campylobacter TaxID=2593542 RepID=UPI001BDA6B96|nr:hypothetical protein [Campylobacter sp. 2018MI13]MBT0882355.1 hypothetical protein [Campylobacter sp. 2018MI13]MBZ7982067.1 hypothetical protein [Campylobacter sp. RM12640]MBZ7988877.1 hypothetical protein [Campylobacter sp. RM12635]